jgi:hypothetical protein
MNKDNIVTPKLPGYMTFEEAAAELGMSRQGLHQLYQRGELNQVFQISHIRVVVAAEVEKLKINRSSK